MIYGIDACKLFDKMSRRDVLSWSEFMVPNTVNDGVKFAQVIGPLGTMKIDGFDLVYKIKMEMEWSCFHLKGCGKDIRNTTNLFV